MTTFSSRCFAQGSVRPSVVAGSGLVALDVVFGGPGNPVALPGGTCANVLLVLGQMGHTPLPLSRLGEDEAGELICEGFRQIGATTRWIQLDSAIRTPVIIQLWQHPRTGEKEHHFSFHSPGSGQRLPAYQSISEACVDQAAADLGHVDVFFFDRISAPVLRAVRLARQGGARIVFEPSSMDDPGLFREASALAHIVKFSRERMGSTMAGWEWDPGPDTLVETSGKNGLSVKFRSRTGWNRRCLSAPVAPRFVDSCGSGDMVSAGLIHWLLKQGKDCTRTVMDGLAYGQELAAANCGFLSARGAFLSIGDLPWIGRQGSKDWRTVVEQSGPFDGLTRGSDGRRFLT